MKETAQQPRHTAPGCRTFRCRQGHRVFNERTGTAFNRLHIPTYIALLVVLWRLRYRLSLRDLAARFRPAFEEQRQYFRVATRRGEYAPLAVRRRLFQDRWAAIMAELAAARQQGRRRERGLQHLRA